MRVVITHHGRLPAPERPVTGGALRAHHHAVALRAAGHEVICITREQDDPSGFRGPADLRARVVAARPDRVVCVQAEDAHALRDLDPPVALDLYAPRIVEAGFDGTLPQTTAMVLGALEHADVILTSNRRQQWSLRTLLTLAGFDPARDPTLLVPLAAPVDVPHARAPNAPVFVAGGARWPWQNPIPQLNRVLAHLDRRGAGTVVWFGGAPLIGTVDGGWELPCHPRLSTPGWLPYGQLLDTYARASAAIDWQGSNPERSLALSFRHLDYLGAGIPILTSADSALVDVLGDAGIASDDIESALDAVLDHPRRLAKMRRAARTLSQESFSLSQTHGALLDWVAAGTRYRSEAGPLSRTAEYIRAAEQATARERLASAALDRAQAEVLEKRLENTRLTEQIHMLTDTLARQARALDEVAGFKREAIQLLGNQSERSRRTVEELERENALLRADNAKKSAELLAMDDLRARLENDLTNLRAELERLRSQRGWLRRS